jgi:serine/threonine protein kinase
MTISAGMRLGPYEILAPAGAGGMGEVWKARDTRLDRTVAVKFARAAFSDRAQREAQAIAALNHPNIATLYDVGANYLVMEYVEGAPLRPVDDIRNALDLATQIADGLAAAHAAGVVHRDLKPDNILVSKSGRVKILDFGLAKQQAAAVDGTAVLTITQPGTVVGTVAYMSPEQARGQELDARSDQFSFGLILYEIAAGKLAFQRETAAETMTAIIREDPEPLADAVPIQLRWIMERLLAKNPEGRYDSTRDLYRDLRLLRDRLSEVAARPVGGSFQTPSTQISSGRAWFAAGGLLVAGASIALLASPRVPADLSKHRFTPFTRDEGQEIFPEWSPDGKSIAYLHRHIDTPKVYVKALGSSTSAQITSSRGGVGLPFWSRDGSSLYFLGGSRVWAVAASGGEPQALGDAPRGAAAASVFPDEKTFAFATTDGLMVGTPTSASSFSRAAGFSKEIPLSAVKISPDGSRIAVRGTDTTEGRRSPTPFSLGIAGSLLRSLTVILVNLSVRPITCSRACTNPFANRSRDLIRLGPIAVDGA